MILRQAKRGPNMGHCFYGCSQFPECNGTLDIPEDEQEEASPELRSQSQLADSGETKAQEDIRPYTDTSSLKFPVVLTARSRAKGLMTEFFDSIAVPNDLLLAINTGEIDRFTLNNYSKWRVDFTPAETHLSAEALSTVSIMEKIVNRGSITRLSGALESKIMSLFETVTVEKYDQALVENTYGSMYVPNVPTQWLDGDKRGALGNMTAEEYFYKQILLDILGPNNIKDVLPQVLFSSLVIIGDKENAATMSQRVDFLVSHNGKAMVIEIDDPTHSNYRQRDRSRDLILEENGLEIFRIPVDELVVKGGINLDACKKRLHDIYDVIPKTETVSQYLQAVRLAQNFQLLLIRLLKVGKIIRNKFTSIQYKSTNLPNLMVHNQAKVLQYALDDLKELDGAIAVLYEVKPYLSKVALVDQAADLVVSVNDDYDIKQDKLIYIQDINFPLQLAQNIYKDQIYVAPVVVEEILRYFLNYIFRFDDFRPNQIDGIIRSLQGEDSIILLPTGSGKSVVYQLLSMILPGMTIIVDPLVSLIEDQVDNLRRVGVDRVIGITSATEYKEQIQDALSKGFYFMAYVSPERFQIEGFRESVVMYCVDKIVSVCAIDEAHCVSEWGHDFRTSYLNLAQTCRTLLKSSTRIPPILALTGTASESVLRDMERDLKIDDDAIVRPSSFDRKEIEFDIIPTSSDKKALTLLKILQEDLPARFGNDFSNFWQLQHDQTNCGLIFCPHIKGKFGVLQVLRHVRNIKIRAEEYYGQQPKGQKPMSDAEWDKVKRINAANFKNNQFPLLVTTKAFGMGIDKPNIRFTIHYGLPQSIEAYYQEAGRAGRDRNQAYSYVIVSNDFPEENNILLGPGTSLEQLKVAVQSKSKFEQDDISRMLYFHTTSFDGVDEELKRTQVLLEKIGDMSRNKRVSVSGGNERTAYEKVVYRLLIIGVISGYTVNFANNEFNLQVNKFDPFVISESYGEYVRGYQDDDNYVKNARQKIDSIQQTNPLAFIWDTMKILLEEFIYRIIEDSRRRAFSNLLQITNEASQIEDPFERSPLVRKRILDFLGNSYGDVIKLIIDSPADLDQVVSTIDSLKNKSYRQLFAELGRTLQAYPEHPGLLLAHLALQFRSRTYDHEVAVNTLFAVFEYGVEKYSISFHDLTNKFVWVLSFIDNEDYEPILFNLIYKIRRDDFNWLLIDSLPEDKKYIPEFQELSRITSETLNTIGKEELWKPKKFKTLRNKRKQSRVTSKN